MNRNPQRRIATLCVLAALALRAAIPAGFMPAQSGSGLLFEMCPSAVPAQILMAMSGSGHHHHHKGHDSGTDTSHFDAGQCPLGQLLSGAVAVDVAAIAPIAPVAATLYAPATVILQSFSPYARRSRGPPA